MIPANLVTISGNVREIVPQLDITTMLHVDELTNERRTNPIDADGTDLRKVWLYTPDGELYSVRNGVPTLSMTRGGVNPFLNRIDDAYDQLTKTGNFRPNAEEMSRALGEYSTVHNDLTKLRLQGNDDEWRFLVVPTKKNHGLRFEEEKLARRVFGDTTFRDNLEMFREAGITESRIYVLAPAYVCQHAGKNPVGRAAWLYNLNSNSDFNASGRDINNHDRSRGVRREEVFPEGNAPENTALLAPDGITSAGVDEIIAYSTDFVPAILRNQFELGLRSKLLPQK